jgi:transcription termination factor Rho
MSDEEQSADDKFGDGVDDSSKGESGPSGSSGADEGSEDGAPRRRRRRRRVRRGGTGGTGGTGGSGGTGGDGGRGGRGDGGGNTRQQGNRNSRRGGGGGGGGGPRRGNSNGARTRKLPANINMDDFTGEIEGVLELHPKGYGFMRDTTKNYSAQDTDAFVSSSFVEKHGLREGVLIKGEVGIGSRGQGPRLKEIQTIDGRSPEEFEKIRLFEDLTPINPFEQIKLEIGPKPITMRVMDLLTPIGKGQRALIVAPPRTGKTMLLQDIAESVSQNHPEVHLIVLLIDERPEEVTEMQRVVKGEVVASSMDREVENHIRISQLIIERGKRLAEAGEDVFILLDSITRTARAFNKWVGNSGRTATGGLDIRALDIPKKLFGTARRFDEGGSLTVVATALIDTGSRMDEAIFQEFKGTGNMELVLSKELADRRIWPAIDVGKSGTRREEKILSEEVLEGATMLRRSLISLNPVEAMEQLAKTLERFPTNKEFLTKIRAVL